MKRSHWFLVIGIWIALTLALPASSAMAAVMSGWNQRTVASGFAEPPNAVVSGDRVAWIASDGAHMQVYTRKMSSDAVPYQITWDDVDHDNLVASGNRLAWTASDGTAKQVFTQLLGADAVPWQLTWGSADCSYLQISGSRLAWVSGLGSDTAIWQQLVGVDANPSEVSTAGTTYNERPVVSGDYVAWIGYPGLGRYIGSQVCVQNMADGSDAIRLTNSGSHTEVAMSGSLLAYDGFTWGQPGGWAEVVDLSKGMSAINGASDGSNDISAVALSGTRFVWLAGSGLYTYDSATGNPIAIPGAETPFALSGDRIFWQQTTGVDTTIYTKDLASDHYGDAAGRRFTTDSGENFAPEVDGSSIQWIHQDPSGGTYSVMIAQPIETPWLDHGPTATTTQLGRKKGRASLTLSMRIGDSSGPLGGKAVYLQTWTKAKGWTNSYRLTTDSSGLSYKSLTWTKAGWTYLRWYVPGDGAHNTVSTSKQGVRVW